MKYEVWVLTEKGHIAYQWTQYFCDSREVALQKVEEWLDRGETCMKPFNEYLAMTAEQIMADPEAPESLRIAARIELEKAQKFNLEAEAARTATDKPV